MDSAIRTNLYILSALLLLTVLSQAASADEIKIGYHCTSEKAVEYRHTTASANNEDGINYPIQS